MRFISTRNCVRHAVMLNVNAVYTTSVATLSAAVAAPHLYARMPETSTTSSAVGTTLKIMLERMKLMPRVPRSMALLSAPVWRPRW